jgi:hypothetical protein
MSLSMIRNEEALTFVRSHVHLGAFTAYAPGRSGQEPFCCSMLTPWTDLN